MIYKLILWLGVFWLGSAAAFAGEVSLVGTHPTSPLTLYPRIHVLKAHGGKIYMGYGNYNVYPVITVTSYDPATHSFRVEHAASTDSIETFRSIGDTLYVPSTDPIHFEGFQDYAVLSGGSWRSFAPVGLFHCYDIGTLTGSDLWLVGSKSRNETPSANATVFRSIDGGRNFLDVTTNSMFFRYYWGFPLQGQFYVMDRVYDGNRGRTNATSPHEVLYNSTALGSGSNEFVVARSGQTLVSYDGSAWRNLRTGITDFVVNNGSVYVLQGTNIWRSTSLSATGATWEQVPLTVAPNSTAIEILDGIAYVADGEGRLWAGRLDGSPVERGAASVVNEMPDAFGRALAVSGTTLAVGAPEFSGGQFLSGQVTMWEQTESGWETRQAIDPPAASFSGWFGKDVALAGDAMAVLEAGRDLSRQDRGSAAQVHLYQRTENGWEWRQTLTHTYAHAVALSSNRLVVATSSRLNIYGLSQSPTLQAALEASLLHGASALYQPTGRVAIDGDKIAYGIVGDFSREGSPGQVNIYETNGVGGWALVSTLVQNSPPLPQGLTRHPDAFGFSLGFKGNWLAVGAPRDDTAALQAGAVHLYERVTAGSTVSYVPRHTIHSPVAQAQARFGASLALTDTHLVVGAPGVDGWERQQGRVLVYERGESNWVTKGEVPRPALVESEFGWEVTATTNLVFASGRTPSGATGLNERVAIASFPGGSSGADVAVSQTSSPAFATNGSVVTYYIAVTNAGPSTGTDVGLIFPKPLNFELESITSSGFACTNTGMEIRCSLNALPAGTNEAIIITGRANLADFCEPMRSTIVVFAREFDPDTANNSTTALVGYEQPVVALLAPDDGTTFPFRAPIDVIAEAAANVEISAVEFYANKVLVDARSAPPYTLRWTNAPAGTQSITARALSRCGIASTSAPRTVIVQSNRPPQVAILHPINGTRFPGGTTHIPIYVTASDADGTVARVDFFWNNIPAKAVFSPPYVYVRSNTTPGSYGIRAAARDNEGVSTASRLGRIVVGAEENGATNWVAYNDHGVGPATRSTVSRWDIQGNSATSGGVLRNVSSGANLPASLMHSRSDTLTRSSPGVAPDAGTPAANIFFGYVDFASGTAANVAVVGTNWVRYTFSGLDPHLRYNFMGTAVRGDSNYVDRWTLVELIGARQFHANHTAGCLGEGTGTIQANQAALNTGDNRAGEVVGWRDIQPAADGTFIVECSQYTGLVPGGNAAGSSGYALTAIRLEEVVVLVDPSPSIQTQPISLTLSAGAAAEFNAVATSGIPITYQWLRNGSIIPGATNASLAIAAAATNDVGRYVLIVTSELGSAATVEAALTLVRIDTDAPANGAPGAARLTIHGAPNQRYSVQTRSTLDSSETWMELLTFTASASPHMITDETSRTATERFYRVVPVQ